MDKRWIYIIIILIIGFSCIYAIVGISDTLGSAKVNFGKFMISLPDKYNIEEDSGDHVRIINRNTHEKIYLKDLGKGTEISGNLTKRFDKLSYNKNITLIEYNKLKLDHMTLDGIYFEKSPNNTYNQACFKTMNNHTILIEASNFNDNASMKKDLNLILDSLGVDYKQKQD